MILTLHFLGNLFCVFISCVYRHENPSDPLGSINSQSQTREDRGIETGGNGWLGQNLIEDKSPIIIETRSGALEGYIMKTIRGRSIYAFEGVPYGETTGGRNSFKPPIPKAPWRGIRSAKSTRHVCLQWHAIRGLRIFGNVDCLTINIYSPQIPAKKDERGQVKSKPKLPVMAWFHGGSNFLGAGEEYGPAYLCERDMILVTVNYRLGIFGFLSTGDEVLPGNLGLKDQRLALGWVHENIEFFGGDPSRVTIAGQSSGAVSVHLHMISKGSHPYFSSAISMSGTAFNSWAIMNKNQSDTMSQRLADLTNCPRLPSQAFVSCLSRMNPYLLVARFTHIFEWILFPIVPLAPVIEPPGPNAFLTESPDEVYARGDVARVPWMCSRTKNEVDTGMVELFGFPGFLRLSWTRHAPLFLDYHYVPGDPTEISNKINLFYLGTIEPRSVQSISAYKDIITDRTFAYPVHKALQAHSQIAPTYSYLYGFHGKYSVAGVFGAQKDAYGPVHADDLLVIFNATHYLPGYKTTDPEYKVIQFMTNLFGNFVSKQEPLYTDDNGTDHKIWDPVTDPHEVRVLEISDHDAKMVPEPNLERLRFWEEVGLQDLKPFIPISKRH